MEQQMSGINLPITCTSEGKPIGIDSEVYVIWHTYKKDCRGRRYSLKEPAVYKAVVTDITFGTDYMSDDEVVWTAGGFALDDGFNMKIKMGCYNTFATREAAETVMQNGGWNDGVVFFEGSPPMTRAMYAEKRSHKTALDLE